MARNSTEQQTKAEYHYQLLLSIEKDLKPIDLKDVKQLCKAYLPREVLDHVEYFSDLVDELTKEDLKVTWENGGYSKLIGIFEEASLPTVVELIKQYEGEIIKAPDELPGRSTSSKKMKLTESASSAKTHDNCGECVREELIDFYSSSKICKLQPLKWLPDFTILLKETYTTLTLRKRKCNHQQGELVIQLCDIFDNTDDGRCPRRILIEGAPGTGKSTLCRKLLLEWASQSVNGRWKINEFEFVIFAESRQIGSNDTNCEFLNQLLPEDFKFGKEEVWKYLTEHQEKVLIIIDGYDELQSSNESLTKLLDGKLMRKACVLVTSRPGLPIFHAYFNKHITNKGFTEEQAFQFIDKYTRNKCQNNEQVQFEAKYLYKTNSVIRELFDTPLTLLFILVSLEYHLVYFTTLAQLYDNLIRVACRRYLNVKFKTFSEEFLTTFVNDLSHELGTVALEGLVNGKVVFDVEEDICNKSMKCRDDIFSVGLLVLDHNFSITGWRQTAFFMHKTVQEFFATIALSNMNNDERSRYYAHMNPYRKSQHSGVADIKYFDRIVSNFLCDILYNKDDKPSLLHFLSYACNLHSEICNDVKLQAADKDLMTTIEANLYKIQIAQEFFLECISQGGDYIDDSMLQCMGNVVVINNTSELPYSHADPFPLVCALIKKISSTNHDGIQYMYIDRSDDFCCLSELTDTMRACKYSHLLGLYLAQSSDLIRNAPFCGIDLVELISPNLQILCLRGLRIEYVVQILNILKVEQAIKQLRISQYKDPVQEVIVALVDFLRVNKTLTDLELDACTSPIVQLCDTDRSAASFFLVLIDHVAIKSIKVDDIHMTYKSATSIVKLLKSNNRITDLDISNNELGDRSMASIITAVKDVKSKVNMYIRKTNSGCLTARAMVDLIRDNKTLNVVDFSKNPIGDDGMASVIEALKTEDIAITIINVSNTNCNHKTVHALIDLLSVKKHRNIDTIDVSENDINDDDMAKLINTIKKEHIPLKKLNIFDSSCGLKTAKSLIDLLKTNTTFYDAVMQSLIYATRYLRYYNVFFNSSIHESVHVLDLTGTELGDSSIIVLSQCLEINHSVTNLILRNTNMGDPGLIALSKSLRTNKSLSNLDISINKVGCRGVNALSESLETNDLVTKLDISGNQIGEPGIIVLFESLEINYSVTELDLSYTCHNVGEPGIVALRKFLKTNEAVSVLKMRGNNMGDSGITVLAETLATNCSLQFLDVTSYKEHYITIQGLSAIVNGLKMNKTLLELLLTVKYTGNDDYLELRRTQLQGWTVEMHNNTTHCCNAKTVDFTFTRLQQDIQTV